MVSTQVITPAVYTPWVESGRNYFRDPRLVGAGWGVVGATAVFTPGSVVITATGTASGNMLTPTVTGDFAALAGAPASVSWKVENIGAVPFRVEPRFWDGSVYVTGVVVTIQPGETIVVKSENKTVAGAYAQPRLWQITPTVGGVIRVSEPQINAGATVNDFVSGARPNTLLRQTSWLGTPDASISVEEIRALLTAEVVGNVYEEVTLASESDSITFRALPDVGARGFVYDNETLQRWYAPADIEVDIDKRPNANGSFDPGQMFTAEHRPLIVGQYYGTDSIDAKAQRARLVGMFNDGFSVTMTVKDESGVATTREVWLVDYDAPFAADFSHFTFDLELFAPDSLRYGATSSDSSDFPTSGSGLVWDLGTAPSTLYFDWGTVGNLGQIELTNVGGAATSPLIEVGGAGAISGGFRITELETGRELTYAQSTNDGDVVTFDSRLGRATLNGGGDVTGLMTSRDWFTIPRGATRRYQINPLGSVTGAPIITGYAASAWL